MSKPPKFNFKDLIAGEAAVSEPVESPEQSAAAAAEPTGEIVRLTPNPIAPVARGRGKAAGQGTLKRRSVQQSLYLEPPVYEQLRELAFHERRAMHTLVLEGLDLLFRKRGLKPLEQLEKLAK